ncbi:ABC transporter permease subunit [Alkaliphilus oremlandii]|uniref:Putative ABC-2 type transport system permease protein n=1 Tax=Alkaliphilus oremlandii (strain OhILAs) TaxID=350688 RepID=A8MFQ1_ALKOO|nr:ABC transporter permease subunit [Alkaliphilus oremlandii]ABW17690.1 putative ABC-2 type transport system permease protein [Alkaliphilus oremlandii OhILAs]
MLNYIKAELYRNFNRVYYWAFITITSAVALLCNILIKSTGNVTSMSLSEIMYIGIQAINLPIFLVLMMVEIVTSEENKNLTIRNAVSFGIPRNKMIASKVVTTTILSSIAALIILTVFLGSGAILLGFGADFSLEIVKDFSLRLLVAVPLWIGAISVGTFLGIVFKSSTVSSFIYFGVFTMARKIINVLEVIVSDKFKYLHKILITTNLFNLRNDVLSNEIIISAILVGVGFTALFTILSMVYFNKIEVK